MKKSILLCFSLTLLFISCKKNVEDLSFTEPKASPAVQEEFRSGIPSGYTACGAPTETPIFAGKTIEVGSVTVWNDATNVYVSYQTTGDYLLKLTHLYVGDCNSIPVNKTGNPKIGNFPYQNDHGTGVSTFTKTIPISSLPAGCLCVAAHAEIVAYNSNGKVSFSQTGWGYGPQIVNGGSWATKFTFCPSACDFNPDADPGR